MNVALQVADLVCGYDKPLLSDLCFTLERGGSMAVVGPQLR